MAWLSGYNYRKKITIDGSAAGIQTNYQMKLTVHKDITSFTYLNTLVNAIDVDPETDNHAEGVASDGTYLYATDRQNIWQLNKDGTKTGVANNAANNDGTDIEQINHIYIHGDYLYVGANNYNTTPELGYIKVYNKSDCSYVEEHQVLNYWSEGCAYYKDSWWVVYYDYGYVSQYNTNWEHIADYALEDFTHAQGVFVIGDYLVVSMTGPNKARLYRWNGSSLDHVSNLDIPEITVAQGAGKEPNKNEVWWADMKAGDEDGDIVHTTIDYDTIGNDVYVGDNCRDDFNDIRFTQSDGETELYHWRESYISAVNATFYIKFNSIPESPSSATFYMYYGKADAISGSDGKNTFDYMDDWEDGTLDGWTDESDANSSVVNDNVVYKRGTKSMKCITDGNDSVAIAQLLNTISSDCILEFDARISDINAAHYIRGVDNATQVIWVGTSANTADLQYYDTAFHQLIANANSNQWYKFGLIFHFSTDKYDIYIDNVLVKSGADFRNSANQITQWRFQGDGQMAANGWVDDFRIRKYCDPEPTWGTWGSEEVAYNAIFFGMNF